MRQFLMLVMLITLTSGCGLVRMGQDVTKASYRLFRPKPQDYFDPANNESDYEADEWSSVGSEGRGDLAREKESDWLTNLESPKTRAINRNLGLD